MPAIHGDWEAVIGLEVHAQLVTRTKAFCGCAPSFGDPPNTHTCPVCLGLPGALPVLNAEAVRLAVRAALALDCEIAAESIFARKNYFYPDLPKGYQISQYDRPLAQRGKLAITSEGDAGGMREVGITRVHMEEDAGKNLHGVAGESVVDLNRAGTPLIEIVGEPELRSAGEAADYLRRLRELLMFVGVCDGNMEQGSFRCDANVSVRRPGEPLGTRTELKNINSFRFVGDAIDGEIRRQAALLERGERVRQQTRGYNADKRESYLLRDKENEAGYRYFPEPDLPPLLLEPGFLAAARLDLPETPAHKRARWTESLGLGAGAAGVLASHPRIAELFDRTVALGADAVKAANFVQAEVLRDARTSGLAATFPVSAEQLHELLALVDEGTISGKQAKEVFAAVSGTERMPRALVAERGMAVMSDEGAIEGVIHAVIADNPKQTEAYRAGKTALLGYFVGQVMKRTGGSANPAVVNALLARHLSTPPATGGKEGS
jgi:aspartyl-tRNA(Asn)/glutamyl-tRNA(Gln) amidotransferase subunit B